MTALELSRWAVVGVKDETGAGRMGQELKRCLNPIRHLVGPSYRHVSKPLAEQEALLACENDSVLKKQLSGLQGIIVFDASPWALQSIRLAHSMGIKTVFVVLWEWFQPSVQEWGLCDVFVCPNQFALKVIRKLGFKNSLYLTWPLDFSALPARVIKGPARTFTHNVGLLEVDDRKSTTIVLEAFAKVPRRDVKLIIRVQNEFKLPCDDARVKIESRHLENHADLYAFGDVAVQPSKCEGLGFMLLEAIASGLPLITTDYPPMNEYVQHKTMRVAPRWGKYPAQQTSYIPHAHFKIPRVSDLTKKMVWCAENDLQPVSVANRAWVEETFNREKVRTEWTDLLERILTQSPDIV